MKLRIKGASLRLRLTQGEIARLAREGVVEEATPFAAATQLLYRLRRDSRAAQITATFSAGELEVRIPESVALQWCSSDAVTLSAEQPVPERGPLKIVLEKDFACLTARPGEDESDNYPHPG